MALIVTDKNGLGAGSAEVLLGSSLLEQHPTALIETPLQGGACFRIHAANSES
jgi:hypothetical protein